MTTTPDSGMVETRRQNTCHRCQDPAECAAMAQSGVMPPCDIVNEIDDAALNPTGEAK